MQSKKLLFALLGIPLLLGLIFLFQAFQGGSSSSTVKESKRFSVKFDKSKSYELAGESFDLRSFDVRERLEREILVNANWISSTTINIKRSARFFPVFSEILAENGVPDDFKYLAVAESNLELKGSPAGAIGLWQFMKDTGKEFGLKINDQVDERYHTEKATEAFCAKIKKDKERFGSWITTMAAYNMGRGGMIRVTDRQETEDYFEMNLSDETMRYPFRVMAIKEIFENPEKYGFFIPENERYESFKGRTKKVEVRSSISSLASFAKKYDMSYRDLKILNPWLRDYKLNLREGERYEIEVFK